MENVREQWQKRVKMWQQSGLSAERFGALHGINACTLRYWKHNLKRLSQNHPQTSETAPLPSELEANSDAALPLIEVRATLEKESGPFELELAKGRRLRIPASFEQEALRRLLLILEENT